jgi:hypothetical protein
MLRMRRGEMIGICEYVTTARVYVEVLSARVTATRSVNGTLRIGLFQSILEKA